MSWFSFLLILLAGFAAGVINTIAGSGSLITLPLLIFLGLPANVANGTNRVAILLQNVVGSASYRQQGVLDTKGALWLGIPAALGAILGAQIAVDLNEAILERSIGIILVIMLFVVLFRPQRWLQGTLDRLETRPGLLHLLLFFLIGVYGGFIQAGVGIFLLAGLVLGVGYDLVRANAVKLFIVLFFTIFALVVFIKNDQVDWVIGLVLAIGNMIGAWLAARLAVDKGAIWVRRFLIAVIAVSAAYMLGLFDLLTL